MHPLIHVYYKDLEAGIFDMDASEETGRFEWLPTFQKIFSRMTVAFENEETSRYRAFDAGCELPPFFRDHLPGSFSKMLLQEALRSTSRTVESLSTLSWLSLTGDRGMGAFRFEPAGYPWQGKGSELSDRRLRDLLRCGLFVHGTSPKIVVAVNDFTGEVLSGQGKIPEGFNGWIVKLDGVAPGSAERLAAEYAFYLKAMDCGIHAAPSRMLRDGHWKHLLVKRFDRIFSEKRPYLTHQDPTSSWEAVFRRMRNWRLPYPDMEEMYRRLVFSILTNNRTYDSSKI
ncbi:MAG: HipA domain-containing protein, partial [Bacteroidia bacterium]|nr:HipA domain-containing protein [Bacteroidia bacterium]